MIARLAWDGCDSKVLGGHGIVLLLNDAQTHFAGKLYRF